MDKKEKVYRWIIGILSVVVLLTFLVMGWNWMSNKLVEIYEAMTFGLPPTWDLYPITPQSNSGEISTQTTPVPTEELRIETVGGDELLEGIPADEIYYAAQGKPAGEIYQTSVEATDIFNEESSWLIAEPGVILDDTAAWVIPSVRAKHFANIPEGGFTYFSLGNGLIGIGKTYLILPPAEGLNYLVLIRGRIDDTIVDSDLNLTAEVTTFVPGHAIWSIMPPGAYVSKNWFREQLVTSSTTGGTNCGATGCTTIHVVLFDVDSHFYQKFEVKANNLDSWELLESN